MSDSKIVVYGFSPALENYFPVVVSPTGVVGSDLLQINDVAIPDINTSNTLDELPSPTPMLPTAASQFVVAGSGQDSGNARQWRPQRGNSRSDALPIGVYNGAQASEAIPVVNARGLLCIIRCLVFAVNFTPTLQGFATRSSGAAEYYTLLAGAAITGIGTTILRVSPDLTAAANLIAQDILPDAIRVSIAAAAGDNTYSVEFCWAV